MSTRGNLPEKDEPIDFRAMYYVVYERRWLITALVALALLGAFIYLAGAPKIYAAQTIIQVEQTPRRVINIQDVNSQDLTSAEVVKSIEASLTSPALLQRVIAVEHLDAASLGLHGGPYTENALLRALAARVSAKLIRGTRLIAVTAENERPELAQKISIGLVTEYRHINTEQRLSVVSEANNVLVSEAARLKQKLQSSEQALQDYKERTQAVSLQETQNIIVEKLKELNAKVTFAKSDRLKLESDYAEVQKLAGAGPEQLLAIPSVADSRSVVEQRRLVSEQEGAIASLNKRYGPLHPKLIQAKSQVEAQRAELADLILRSAEAMSSALEAAKQTESKFEEALAEQEQKALELNKLAIPYTGLQREVEGDRALYDAVLNRLKETDVTKSIQQDDIIVKSPAVVPDRPIKPRKLLILVGSALSALVAGVGLALGLRTLDTSIRTIDDGEGLLQLPAVGVIPTTEQTRSGKSPLVMVDDPSGFTAEAVRSLRTSLSLTDTAEDQTTVLFTSALSGEGKSFCAINYAVACAQQGLRTLLIDADLRLRSLGRVLLSDDTRPGVTDLVSGESILDVCIQHTNIAGFSLLTAGRRAPNPLELLAGNEFNELIEKLKLMFDRVVIDSAPVNAVSDSLLLVKNVGAVCFVVRSGRTPRKAALRAIEKLREAGARLCGFVLNGVTADNKLAAYYGYAVGGYGVGVYGAEDMANISEPPPSSRPAEYASHKIAPIQVHHP